MTLEIKAPVFPESVTEGVIARWNKQPGDFCEQDELLVEIETDKVVLEIVAPASGVLEKIIKDTDATIASQEVIGLFEEGATKATSPSTAETKASPAAETKTEETVSDKQAEAKADQNVMLGPAARKICSEKGINPEDVKGTGKGGRITKEDIINHAETIRSSADDKKTAKKPAPAPTIEVAQPLEFNSNREEKRVPMTRLRKRVAQRLLDAKNNTAMLTTFNEVNLKPIMDLRKQHKDTFEKRHNTRLGFMSFFVKASVEALRRFPVVNASIDGDDVVYHGYQDIGVAVSSDRGLVVPVLRSAENMTLAEIESKIREFGTKAQEGKLTIEEITGGTFTVSNGGVFGSMLSTPILNPPQSAILGMHAIKERPIAENGEVIIRPMMYLALSYDHRLLDGKEAVSFLATIKDFLEEPVRILLDI